MQANKTQIIQKYVKPFNNFESIYKRNQMPESIFIIIILLFIRFYIDFKRLCCLFPNLVKETNLFSFTFAHRYQSAKEYTQTNVANNLNIVQRMGVKNKLGFM